MPEMYREILESASKHLQGLSGHMFDVLTISKPISPDAAVNLSKVVSKLSPLLGNLIEFNTVEFLNDVPEYRGLGEWQRQDPGFPDTIFVGPTITPRLALKSKHGFHWQPKSPHVLRTVRSTLNTNKRMSVC